MKRALIGYGGHTKEVLAQIGETLPCFVDDQYVVEGTLSISLFDPNEYEVMVALGNSKHRYDIVQRLPKETKYFTFIHPTALIMDTVDIGEGSFIGAYSILTTNIKIGKHALLNRSVQIGHDSVIGDYFSAMPGAIVSGNVTIYDCVYMGSNSTIKEKISVHSLSTLGINAAVVKHIEASGTYVGVPAKLLK
jgi:sugar O-acyltransferase (sialic acid O-acetyltransferase NeuD family)